MTTPTKEKKIHALIGVTKLPDGNFTPLLDSSLKGLLANANIYTKPPVDLTLYGNGISAYETSIPAALDGSKTAKAQKDKLRAAATKMYVELAHYVEANLRRRHGNVFVVRFSGGFDNENAVPTDSAAHDHVSSPRCDHGPDEDQGFSGR